MSVYHVIYTATSLIILLLCHDLNIQPLIVNNLNQIGKLFFEKPLCLLENVNFIVPLSSHLYIGERWNYLQLTMKTIFFSAQFYGYK